MNKIDAAGAHSAVPSYPRGLALLRDPLLNKGTAFTEQERDALGLRGLLPAHVLSMEEQAERMLTNLRRLPTELDKYVALNALHDRNETLFFRVVCDNLEEIQPIIYTPTVGRQARRPKFLFLGAGEAATGIADLIVSAMVAQGCPDAEARRRIWLVDSRGLVVKGRVDLAEHKLAYAHEHAPIGDFLTAIRTFKPTGIVGVAATGGAFTREVLQAMAQLNERPIVFALSNPTSKSECTAEEAYRHTDGRALFACGSPYEPVQLNGAVFVPRQGNNSNVFPGVGLGAIASDARRITDEMFMTAALTLAQLVNDPDLEQGSLYPALPRIREVSARIAAEVAQVAYKRGLTAGEIPDDVLMHVTSHIYEPRYCCYA